MAKKKANKKQAKAPEPTPKAEKEVPQSQLNEESVNELGPGATPEPTSEAISTNVSAEVASNHETPDQASEPEESQNKESSDGQKQQSAGPDSDHDEDDLQAQLEAMEAERDEIQEEYDNLLEKVGTIKHRLGERFKELEKNAEDARSEAARFKAEAEAANAELLKTRAEILAAKNEISTAKAQTAEAQREADVMKGQLVSQKIMFDQESANDQSSRDNLELQLSQLRAQLESEQATSSRYAKLNESQEKQIAELNQQRVKLVTEKENEIKKITAEARKLREEQQSALNELENEKKSVASLTETSMRAVDRQKQLETESKESQLLIGKLRHEAVILNEHLTHALRIVREDSKGNTVDKELVSNLFVQYTTCPRQDTKKFEILMVIANFLGWDDDRRKEVGLEKNDDFSEPPPPTQMVGMVGKLAEFLDNRRSK